MDSKVVKPEDADRMVGVYRAIVPQDQGAARYDVDEAEES
jgi:hypothetical protein